MADDSTKKTEVHSDSDTETQNCQTVSRLLVKYPCQLFFAFLFIILGMTMIAGAADHFGLGGILDAVTGISSGDPSKAIEMIGSELGIDKKVLGVVDNVATKALSSDGISAKYAMKQALVHYINGVAHVLFVLLLKFHRAVLWAETGGPGVLSSCGVHSSCAKIMVMI